MVGVVVVFGCASVFSDGSTDRCDVVGRFSGSVDVGPAKSRLSVDCLDCDVSAVPVECGCSSANVEVSNSVLVRSSIVSLILPARLGGAVTPPAAGSPSCSRVARHTLYLVNGKRSLTSSMVNNFFSRFLRGRAMLCRSMGSPVSASI